MIILDVGHGNCTIVRGAGCTAVIDSPAGSALLDTLDQLGITHVEHAFISHADADHIHGILALLTSTRITVGCLYLNPDRDRKSTVWKDLVAAVAVASRTGKFRTVPSLTVATPDLVVGDLRLKIVSPSSALALSANGGVAPAGGTNTANSLSAVIKVERYPDVGVLLAGDLDVVALKDIQTTKINLEASALVFPHHGGLPGTNQAANFAAALLSLVQPDRVFVSNGRNKHGNPRADVVGAILDYGCGLACTQLATACGEARGTAHLEDWPASGKSTHHSCAGTISLTLTEHGALRDKKAEASFREFVSSQVASPMCARTKH
ncbi:ComEC/Rec2 family competence protein [Tianweitania aestuarii]|uniref:ComEC/Rec2 family competence protein n=1 Tax=Tianweitania aestuarii TaxID=2814886 RepID=UPI0032655A3A